MICAVKKLSAATMNIMGDSDRNNSAPGRDNLSTDDDDEKLMWERTFSNRRISTVTQHSTRLSDELPPSNIIIDPKSPSVLGSYKVPLKSSAHLSPNPLQLQLEHNSSDSEDDKKPAACSSAGSDQKDSDTTVNPNDSPFLGGGDYPPSGSILSETEVPLHAGQSFISRDHSFNEDHYADQFLHVQHGQGYMYPPPHYQSNMMQHHTPGYHHVPTYPPPTAFLSPAPMSYFPSPVSYRFGPGNTPFIPQTSQTIRAENLIHPARPGFIHESSGRMTRSRTHQRTSSGDSDPRYFGHETSQVATNTRHPDFSSGRRQTPLAPRDRAPGPSEEELEAAQNKRARDALYTWYERLAELYAYKVSHGDCNVPQQYPENRRLGIWVNKQRMEKKSWETRHMPDQIPTSLSERKLQELERIGFIWAKPKGEQSWYEKYYELREYYRLNQHCNVPTKYGANPALGRWVSTQRSQYKDYLKGKSTKITQQRIDMLTRLNFTWDMVARTEDDE